MASEEIMFKRIGEHIDAMMTLPCDDSARVDHAMYAIRELGALIGALYMENARMREVINALRDGSMTY